MVDWLFSNMLFGDIQKEFSLFVFVVLFTVSGSLETQNTTIAPWYGMAPNSCHGRTCRIDQYCSDAANFQGCRPCSNLLVWCDVDMSQIRQKYPSCEAECERKLSKTRMEIMENKTKLLQEQKDDLELELQMANSTRLEMAAVLQTKDMELSNQTKLIQELKATIKLMSEKNNWLINIIIIISIILILILIPILICAARFIKRCRKKSGIRCVITKRPDLNPHLLSENGLEMEPLKVTCPDASPLPFALQVEDGYETGSFTSTATTAPPSPDLPRPTEACNEPIRSFGPENGGCQEQLVI